jgi:phosphoenolpyruvate carboxylase
MEVEKKLQEQIKSYQQIYPGKILYFTEDGNCFLDKSPAIDHARKTKQKYLEVKPAEKADEKVSVMTKEEAIQKLLDLEITDDFEYALAKEFVKVLELKTESQKKDDLLYALEEFKNSIGIQK